MRRWVNLIVGKRVGKCADWFERRSVSSGAKKPIEFSDRALMNFMSDTFCRFRKSDGKAGVGNRDEKPVRFREMKKKWPRARGRNGPRWSLLWRGHMRAELSRERRWWKKDHRKWSYGVWQITETEREREGEGAEKSICCVVPSPLLNVTLNFSNSVC